MLTPILAVYVPTSVAGQYSRFTIYTENFRPYNYKQEDKIVGINVDVVKMLCERLSLACHFELYPWKRTYKLTQERVNSGMLSTVRLKERENLFKWVGPLVSSKSFLYKLASRTDVQPADFEDCKRFSVASIRGSSFEKVLLEHGFKYGENLIGFNSSHDYLDLFFKGKIDLIQASDIILPDYLNSAGYSPAKVKKAVAFPMKVGNYLAVNLDTDDALVKALNLQLTILKEDNVLDSIVDKYLQP